MAHVTYPFVRNGHTGAQIECNIEVEHFNDDQNPNLSSLRAPSNEMAGWQPAPTVSKYFNSWSHVVTRSHACFTCAVRRPQTL
eukprot:6174413-Pleurochrysis_carterae.AAC.2